VLCCVVFDAASVGRYASRLSLAVSIVSFFCFYTGPHSSVEYSEIDFCCFCFLYFDGFVLTLMSVSSMHALTFLVLGFGAGRKETF
jgi:hypothetical protein